MEQSHIIYEILQVMMMRKIIIMKLIMLLKICGIGVLGSNYHKPTAPITWNLFSVSQMEPTTLL